MGYIDRLLSESGDFMRASKPSFGRATDAVPHDTFEGAMFAEVVSEAPALRDMIRDLNEAHAHTTDMAQDVLMEFWQHSPVVRPARDMSSSHLANHAVAKDIDIDPSTAELRGFTMHDKYGAAMATIKSVEKIKETLDRLPDELEQKAQEAEKRKQDAAERRERLQDAVDALMAALSMAGDTSQAGTGDAEGPSMESGAFTAEQDGLAEALAEALTEAGLSQADAESAADEALDAAEAVGVQLAQPLAEAIKEATEQLSAEAALFAAWGIEPGEIDRMDFEQRRRLVEALTENKISKFLDLVGRFRMMVSAEETHHTSFGRDEVVDTELSGRFGDALGMERARLAGPNLIRLEMLGRLANEELITTKYHGIERVGKGSLIYVCDVSGSMRAVDENGIDRDTWAKAFMMALLYQAKMQRRDFVVILFSSRSEQRMWTFEKGHSNIQQVIEVVEFFYGNGTDFMQPLSMAAEVVERDYNKAGTAQADIVFITDGIAPIRADWLVEWNELKDRTGLRVHGIMVGDAVPESVKSVSNSYREMQEFAEPHDVVDIVRQL